jgi:hypothetical protein
MDSAERLFFHVRRRPFFYRLTVFTRILLAAGFIPTGLVKLLGERFTLMPAATPIGGFFEAMYQTGLYWQFLGLSQIVAGLLLLVPPLAHLGAAMFLPIMANIFVVTVALDFTGTPVVAGLMLLAVLYLCLWDFHRFRPLLTESSLDVDVARHRLDPWETLGFTAFAAALLTLFLLTRGFLDTRLAVASLIGGTAAGLLTLGRFLWLVARGRSGRLVEGDAGHPAAGTSSPATGAPPCGR